MTGRFFRVCAMVMFFTLALSGCETAKKLGKVISNPDIQVGDLKSQPSEITITLLTEPDANLNADGEAAPVDVQLVYPHTGADRVLRRSRITGCDGKP